jgi:hypothetical protein
MAIKFELLGRLKAAMGSAAAGSAAMIQLVQNAADVTDTVGNYVPMINPATKQLDPSVVPAPADTVTIGTTAGAFSAGQILVGFNGTSAVPASCGASNTTAGTTNVTKPVRACAGFLKASPGATDVVVTVYGSGTIPGLTGLVAGRDIYLDPANDGKLTNTTPARPAGGGYETISQGLGVAYAANTAFFTREEPVYFA